MKKNLFLGITVLLFSCHHPKDINVLFNNPEDSFSTDGKNLIVYTTADSTDLRLTPTDTLRFVKSDPIAESRIYVFADPDKTFQTILGIGGAITDASAETFARLPGSRQEELIRSYYDIEGGIGYSLARTNINSCDFSSASYTYIDEGDKELSSFNIEPDKRFKIPLIKKAVAASGGNLTLFASPWSPPAFMKDNNDMLHGGRLEPEFYEAWAEYFARFIKSYEEEGVPVWGISIQNEPMATQIWESCIYSSEEERDFLKEFLGPVLEKEGLGDKKIIIWDHNRDLIVQRASVILDDPDAARYAWGIGFHWYEGWNGGEKMYGNVNLVHQLYPDKNLLFTEGTPAGFDPERYYSWALGEAYGKSMIMDFNNWAVGWTDWNILLDETGGPNHVGNFCFAPVHADTRTGELIYTNSYYYIGHFSRFVRPGAKRIMTSPSRSHLLSAGFINEDDKVAIVVMNQGSSPISYNLYLRGNSAEISIPPRSIQTLIIN